jgi:gluconate:H+ symporter, GntP family
MDPIIALILTITIIAFVASRHAIPPFLTLTGGAFFFALLTGMGEGAISAFTGGAGALFALLGIPVYCGSVIAKFLKQDGGAERVVEDIGRVTHRPVSAAALAGYLLSIPMMCCITPFLVLTPVLAGIRKKLQCTTALYYAAACGSVISFVFLYPLPVTYAITNRLQPGDFVAGSYLQVAIPLSLVALIIVAYLSGRLHACSAGSPESEETAPGSRRQAWIPVMLPVACLAVGHIITPLSILANINIALFAGLCGAAILSPAASRIPALESGTKHAGIIIFDLCGAGGLGAVVAAEGGIAAALPSLTTILPAILVAFVIAALFQAAQGSRVVSAVITASLLAGTEIVTTVPALPLVLMIAAGCMMFSFVTDPFFWLIRRTTGDSVRDVTMRYTVPLFCAGTITAGITLLIFG